MNVKNEIINIDRLRSPAITQSYQHKQTTYLRNAFLYAIIYIAIAAGISYAFTLTIVPDRIGIEAILIPAVAYLFIGILFTYFLYTKLKFLDKQNLSSGFAYSLIVFASIFFTIFFISVIKGKEINSLTTCSFYSCLFLLPYTIHQSLILYTNLAIVSMKKIWYLPEYGSQAHSATVFLNSIHIKIKMAPEHGIGDKIYETTVPGRLSLGNMFSNFIYDAEKNAGELIKLKDDENHMYGWQFFTQSFLGVGKRLMDAELSLNENNIKNNSLIFARRVKINSPNQNQLSV